MPTNDERREVAARLRFYADTEPSSGAGWLGLEQIVFGSAAKCGSTGMLLTRLADLIEPEPERTCRMVKPEWAGPKSRTKVCSECGVQFETWLENYCSHCGAKVVR